MGGVRLATVFEVNSILEQWASETGKPTQAAPIPLLSLPPRPEALEAGLVREEEFVQRKFKRFRGFTLRCKKVLMSY